MKHGSFITYRRNPDYWGMNTPVRKGLYNFDTITVEYYRDQNVSVEAFKAGEFDLMLVNIAKQWARDMVGKKFSEGILKKQKFPHGNNAGMQAFVFNTRKDIFKDWRVRKAIGLAFDFEWVNATLFYNQYTRNDSFFSNSYLRADGLPAGLELELLEPHRDELPREVFQKPLKPPVNETRESLRRHLIEAQELLRQAGWRVKNGKLKNSQGDNFHFELLLVSPSFERVCAPFADNLRKLGITVDYKTIDPALYFERRQNFNFDMLVHVYSQSLLPGNEQRDYWHSEAARRKGSKNLAGIESRVVDTLVEKIIYSTSQEELIAACKALDRVLWYGYYVIPNWYLDVHRLAYYNKFKQPEILPKYYSHYDLLMTWWMDSMTENPGSMEH